MKTYPSLIGLLALASVASGLLSACGQKGALYLPEPAAQIDETKPNNPETKK